jgi:hypothetical protein
MSRLATTLVFPAVALLLFAGCSTAATASPSPADTASPSPADTASPSPADTASPSAGPTGTPYQVNVPEVIRGKWIAQIEGTDIASGQWQLEITNNEMIAFPPPGGETFFLGVTVITADHVTFSGGTLCPDGGQASEGTYTYSVQGDHLAFTLIGDACSDRGVLLTSSDWRPQP